MAARVITSPDYLRCKTMHRQKPNVPIPEELLQTFANESDTIPLFEHKIYDYKYMKHYSLRTNDFLKCEMRNYISELEGKTQTPFQFPNAVHNHYINYLVRYKPSETITERPNNRFTMKTGPGLDAVGQRPIVNDIHLRKTSHGVSSTAKARKTVKTEPVPDKLGKAEVGQKIPRSIPTVTPSFEPEDDGKVNMSGQGFRYVNCACRNGQKKCNDYVRNRQTH